MTKDIENQPTLETPTLLHQALISGVILLAAIAVHQVLNWRGASLQTCPEVSNKSAPEC